MAGQCGVAAVADAGLGGRVYTDHRDDAWGDEILSAMLLRGELSGLMPVVTSLGRDYKLTLSWLYRPTHPWQWPVKTATGWCWGRIGLHAKGRVVEVLG